MVLEKKMKGERDEHHQPLVQGEAGKRAVQVCAGWVEEGAAALEEMEGEARGAPLQYR